MLMMPSVPCRSNACACTPAYVTGNRTASITVSNTFSMLGPSGGPYEQQSLVDGVSTNGNGFSNESNVGKYFRFDFGSGASVKITEAKWYQDGSTTHGTFKWQGSNNASIWTDIGSTFTLGGSSIQTITALSANATGYRYYQLIGTSGSVSGTPSIYEIEFKQCAC